MVEIRRICGDAGLSWEELADRVALKRDSMRKIVNGYQPASEQLLQSMRNAAELEKLRRAAGPMSLHDRAPETTREVMALNYDNLIEQVVGDLTYIRARQPDIFESLTRIVKSHRDALAHVQPLAGAGLNSGKVAAAAKASAPAAAKIAGVSPAPSPKREAGVPSARTRRQEAGADEE